MGCRIVVEEIIMAKEKIEVGDLRPVYQQVGWEVCKTMSEKEENQEWIACEKQVEAEILSATLKNANKKVAE